MTYVVSLEGYRPGQRYDNTPWTRARIEQAALRPGPYTVLETQNLSPLDADPTQPQARNFTTALATIPAGWFKVVFLDAVSAEQPADPVFFPAERGVSLDAFKQHANVTRDENDELLQRELDAAMEFARSRTGRQLDPLPIGSGNYIVSRRVAGKLRFVRVPDARELNSITIDDEVVEPEVTYHQNGLVVALELPVHHGTICELIGKFGFDPLPDDLREAILEEAAHRYYGRATGNADTASSEEYGPAPFSRPPGWARAVMRSYRVVAPA